MTGLTAYFGLLDVGRPAAGETVVVSGAAGAVGSAAGQIARIKGCRAVGIAGGTEKCDYARGGAGFDAAIDYKSRGRRRAPRELCPTGIDVYFDNVGGAMLDDALALIARARASCICGAISQYNATGPIKGPSNYMSLLVNHASMTGFVIFDYADRYAEGARRWRAGSPPASSPRARTSPRGLENFPETLLRLFAGENMGKLVLQVADD